MQIELSRLCFIYVSALPFLHTRSGSQSVKRRTYRARCRCPNASDWEVREEVVWLKERKPLKLLRHMCVYVVHVCVRTHKCTAMPRKHQLQRQGTVIIPEVEDGGAWPQRRQGSGPEPAVVRSLITHR